MAEGSVKSSDPGAGTTAGGGAVVPSFRNALPYYLSLGVFPLVVNAAVHGGWWIVAPFAFYWLAGAFESLLGDDERNMDPERTLEGKLVWYKLAVWLWALLWPVTFVFGLWQILVVGHLSPWEVGLMALALATVAQSVFIVGHEMVHRHSVWERRYGEFLLSSVSYPHYVTEHIYIHHALVGTPFDVGSAPKGQSFWHYFPREVASNLAGAWRVQRERLARRHRPVWHHSNPFWRYLVEVAFWYALIWWMGGAWAVLVFAVLCLGIVFSMKLSNYIQHYGLRRIRLPSGKFERVQPWHAWSADRKVDNWLFFNMQRHADHHAAAGRRYPLMQHHGGDMSPQLPGSYGKMFVLALIPRRWFRVMDPLVDEWRARFYPEVEDWSAYDSPAFAARPDAYEAVAEILGAAPRLGAWIERAPELLDALEDREFADLDLPDGLGPDPEFGTIARRGLALVYWTHELGVPEMKERIAEIPVQGVHDTVEAVRSWSNDKVFQIGVHTLRANLSPVEAGTALSNIAEASIAAVLAAAEEAFTDGRARPDGGGVAAVLLGDAASREVAPGAELDVLFVHDGGPSDDCEALCRSFLRSLRALSEESLLFAPIPRGREGRPVRTLAGFVEHHRTAGSTGELLDLTRARCVFTSGDAGIGRRFDDARREVFADGAACAALIAELENAGEATPEPGLASFDGMRGGLRDVERAARRLQLTHPGEFSGDPAPAASTVFRTAGARGWTPEDVAERLARTAKTWRNLRGVLRLVAENGVVDEPVPPKVGAVIARSSGVDDVGALTAAVREAAARATADLDTLEAKLRLPARSDGDSEPLRQA